MNAPAALRRRLEYAGPAIFSYGFRPFFLGAAVWAALSVALWLPQYFGEMSLPTALSPLDWHIHEMIYGYVAAAVAGFLLTAIPNWTGRLPVNGYPYFPVVCKYCHEHPFRWTRTLAREDAELVEAKGEAGRLAVDRRLGWNTVPSNNFSSHPAGGETVLEGSGQGHGIGLCQRGAEALAAGGANFRDILSRYFPNTSVIRLQISERKAQ